MKHLTLSFTLVLAASLVGTTPLQSASKDFRNRDLCPVVPDGLASENIPVGGAGSMRVIAKYKPQGSSAVSIDTGTPADIGFAGCESGAVATNRSAMQLCLACEALPSHKAVTNGILLPPYPDFDCATLVDGAAATTFYCAEGVGAGEVLRVKVDNNVTDSPPALILNAGTLTTDLIGVTHTTNAGNEVGTDLLPNLIVQVTPGSTQGPVIVAVDFQGGTQSRTVTTSGKTATQIHQDLAAAFTALGFGEVRVILPADNWHPFQTAGMFNDGPSVFVANVQTIGDPIPVIRIRIQGGIGDLVEVENSELPPEAVPAMSPLSILVLVGILSLTGVWLLRRRAAALQS